MRGVWIAALVLACGHVTSPLPAFTGPGRLLLILERDGRRELVVFDARGSQRLPLDAPREARFIGPDSLLVVSEVPAEEEFRLPNTQMRIVDLASGSTRALGEPARHYECLTKKILRN